MRYLKRPETTARGDDGTIVLSTTYYENTTTMTLEGKLRFC
jgi:hypothetical protein